MPKYSTRKRVNFNEKAKKVLNHRVKDFKAEIGKKMPCRKKGGELDEKKLLQNGSSNATSKKAIGYLGIISNGNVERSYKHSQNYAN